MNVIFFKTKDQWSENEKDSILQDLVDGGILKSTCITEEEKQNFFNKYEEQWFESTITQFDDRTKDIINFTVNEEIVSELYFKIDNNAHSLSELITFLINREKIKLVSYSLLEIPRGKLCLEGISEGKVHVLYTISAKINSKARNINMLKRLNF